jgi:hypothetical protein
VAIAKINWAWHWRRGHFILHTPRWSFKLRGPDEVPYFTERYVATTRRLPLGGGWRFLIEPRH